MELVAVFFLIVAVKQDNKTQQQRVKKTTLKKMNLFEEVSSFGLLFHQQLFYDGCCCR